MTQQQAAVARQIMTQLEAPPWSDIIDAALHDNIAFTDQAAKKVYIDAKRMLNTPHSWSNCLVHEVMHLKNSMHGDGTLAMAYSVTTNLAGDIIDDTFLLLPTLPPRPSLAQSRASG